jgi:hypothetical protein
MLIHACLLCPFYFRQTNWTQIFQRQPRVNRYTTHTHTHTHTHTYSSNLLFTHLIQWGKKEEGGGAGFLSPTIRNNYHFPQASRAAFLFDACLKEMEGKGDG